MPSQDTAILTFFGTYYGRILKKCGEILPVPGGTGNFYTRGSWIKVKYFKANFADEKAPARGADALPW
ncbi:hypothetical protein TREAZ_2785 [Leadbettera azotonutricia ZAS-9]|uniref:Uncharacterized protein n=1 Tax=Leadbettera azotonutricia (strain ATCC BAA-888 / DSM 13862 / ZAS-9) TaxID=545695 RepID=F5YD29_LEAAZ|nr:hypothetical protein TREAZ_2785 [Leadbettera azotonutricia ZAS-9]